METLDVERRLAAILVADVVGYSRLMAADEEVTIRTLTEYRGEIERLALQHRGRIVDFVGDAFLAEFPAALDAVRCATRIQRHLEVQNLTRPEDRRMEFRMGVHLGDVAVQGERLYGDGVNIAARIMSKAGGSQILVSEAVRSVIARAQDCTLRDRGPFWLKGFAERWRLHELLWHEERITSRRQPPVIVERTPFVGRESERADLRRFLEQMKSGRGTLVMIGGEPGVGKSRLAAELVVEARQHGLLTLTGHCYQMEGAPPYIPFVEVVESAARIVAPEVLRTALGESAPEVAKLMPELRRLFPDIPAPMELPPEQERWYLFNAIRRFIARAGGIQPLLLVLEDLHWTDEPTLLLLQHLAQQLDEIPVLIVATYRDVELEVAPSLAKALEELGRQRLAHDVILGRLPEADVAAMLKARSAQEPPAAVVAAVFAETEGNPFFVEEVFKHLDEEGKLFDTGGRWRTDLEIDELDVPRSVRLAIEHRLARVSEACRNALTSAAVIGRGFGFELLRELVDLDEDGLLDAIDAAQHAQLIAWTTRGAVVRFTFFHELIRQTLLSSLSPLRLQRLHLRVAEAMERVYAADLEGRAADLAHHFQQAGDVADVSKAVRYLTLAGDRALAAAGFEDALRLYEDALSLQPPDCARARADLLYRRGTALRSRGRWEEPVPDWQEAVKIYEGLGDSESVAHVCAELSLHFGRYGRLLEALEIAQHGLAALGDCVTGDRCRLLASVGFVLGFLPGRAHVEASAPFDQALRIAEKLDDTRILGSVLHRKSFHHSLYWESAQGVAAGVRAAELLRPVGNLYDAASALNPAQWAQLWLGNLDEAARLGKEARALAVQTGNDIARRNADHPDALREVACTGDLDRFERRVVENLEFARGAGLRWIFFDYGSLGRLQFWRGRWEEAKITLQEGVQLEIPGATSGYCLAPLFLVTAHMGDANVAAAILQSRRQPHPAHAGTALTSACFCPTPLTCPCRLSFPGWGMVDAGVQGLAALGKWDEAARLYPVVLEEVATGNVIRGCFDGLVQTVAGIAATACRRWDPAEEHYQMALRQAHEIPHKIEQPEIRRWYARMLIDRNASGDRAQAGMLLNEAIAMYGALGMPKHREMAAALLERVSTALVSRAGVSHSSP